jgi:hypothetical protein
MVIATDFCFRLHLHLQLIGHTSHDGNLTILKYPKLCVQKTNVLATHVAISITGVVVIFTTK